MTRAWGKGFALAAAFFAAIGLSSCGDERVTSPVSAGTFYEVSSIFQADCGACHTSGSGHPFIAAMDSSSLVSSGLIDPESPPQSLLMQKARGVSHGGGVVSTFTSVDSDIVTKWIAKQPVVGGSQLIATRTRAVISPDGMDVEDSWKWTKTLVAKVGGGWADATEVRIKALYDDNNIYLLIKWEDDAASYLRQPFTKGLDGTWRKLSAKPAPKDGTTWAAYMGGSGFEEEDAWFLYEDKFAILWNTYGATHSPAFERNGCAGLCHDPNSGGNPGTTYNSDPSKAAKKYTNSTNEIVDMWHWKLVRQNLMDKMDDQNVKYWSIGMPGAEGGRTSDAGAGGYTDVPANADGSPMYRGKSLLNPFFAFPRADTVRLSAAELGAIPAGALVPSMMFYPMTGQRADIDAKGYYNPNVRTWTLEIRRKRVTGDDKDVQFDNLAREYKFGVAIFDNAQIEHSWTPMTLNLIFQR